MKTFLVVLICLAHVVMIMGIMAIVINLGGLFTRKISVFEFVKNLALEAWIVLGGGWVALEMFKHIR